MQATGPHYLLFADSVGRNCEIREWRFVLQPTGEGERIVASDVEQAADSTRLDLLAVVRGLEALDGPSRVTLLAANRFVRHGVRRDLAHWRERGWRWERFGKLVPIRDLDLWKRVDRALRIHQVDCVAWTAEEQENSTGICPGRLSDHSAREDGTDYSKCQEPNIVIVPRRGENRTYPQRRQGFPAHRQLTLWGQEMLNSLSGLGRTALSRTA